MSKHCVIFVGILSLFSLFAPSATDSTQESSVCTGDCLDSKVGSELREKCPDLQSKILVNFVPAGNYTAGAYERFEKGDNSTEECARHCCSSSADCNYAFLVGPTCFTLTCNKGPEPCVPMKVPPEKLNVKVEMVLVRNVANTVRETGGACEVGLDLCPENEECVSANSRSRNGLCQCKEGFLVNPEGQCVPPADMALPSNEDVTIEQTTAIPISSSSTQKTIRPLKVYADDKNVTLPDNEVALYVHVNPADSPENPYQYEWRLISHPTEDTSEGTKEGQMTRRLHLMGLKQGSYVFQVTVKGSNTYGTTNATVNVFPQNRTNLAPVAVISPAQQTVKMPTASVVLDAGSSTDDEKIVSYKWELQKGPIEYTFSPLKSVNSTTLQVENLIPGNYTFKLTVEDAGHLTNSTTANITVIKETDYPPTAIAGKDVVIYLPTNEVTLNGNGSTDDKKIVAWEWKATGEANKAADMQDTRTPYLKLSNLQEGMYTYELKVTDEAGQSSTSTVHVFLKKPSGNPPKASAGADVAVYLPQTWVTLDASESKADTKIVKWNWTELKGPTNATILQGNQVIANVTGLTKGDYEFQVQVEDDAKLTAKSSVKVSVMQKTNEPPVAHAGGETTITLPATIAILNGSLSKDDVAIKQWKWERTPESSAAGIVLGKSDLTPILELSGLVPGKYLFKLTVKDEQGLSSQDTATLVVKEDPRKKNLIEIVVNVPLPSLKEADLDKFLQQLSFLLHDTQLVLEHMQSQLNTENAVLILHGENEKKEIVDGPKLAWDLRQRLRQDVGLLQLQVVTIDTVLCLDPCSGHGVCHDSASEGRQCVCHAFWMENFLKRKFGNGERNCEWSKVYVGVITSLLLIMVAALFWSLLFLYRKNLGSLKRTAVKVSGATSAMNGSARMNGKRHHHHSKKQYTLLDDDEIELESKDDDEAEFEDSDSDVLFETAKRPNSRQKNSHKKYPHPSSANGSHRNGILKNPRRLKT